MMEDQRKWIIRLVSIMWALNLGAAMIPPLHYHPSEAVNGIFMVIVGWMFVRQVTSKEPVEQPAKAEEE